MSQRLTYSQIKPTREALWLAQGKKCALSHYPIALEDAVLDHSHLTGHVRAVLHRGVNAMLGKIENNAKRYGVSHPMLVAMCKNLGDYLDRDYSNNPLHPTYKDEEAKRLRRNMLARKRRAAKKEGK